MNPAETFESNFECQGGSRRQVTAMKDRVENGTHARIEGEERVFYDGYWIRWYEPPPETLDARRELILTITRRAFHHTEAGINTPGPNLAQARAAYERETDPERKRVNAAMLAGALFNRATDIFTSVVDLAGKGVEIAPSNSLLRECGYCFKEALKLGKQVRHYSGHEGIDELWGEPLKAFTMPIAAFYESRYIKIAQTMRDIDRITERVCELFGDEPGYEGFAPLTRRFAAAARREAETMKSDPVIFEVWPEFVATRERLDAFRPVRAHFRSIERLRRDEEAHRLIGEGRSLISYVAGARVPMPKSTEQFLRWCERYRAGEVGSLRHPVSASGGGG